MQAVRDEHSNVVPGLLAGGSGDAPACGAGRLGANPLPDLVVFCCRTADATEQLDEIRSCESPIPTAGLHCELQDSMQGCAPANRDAGGLPESQLRASP